MQLAIRRSWSNTELTIICQIRLTQEERDLVETYDLYETTLYRSSSGPPSYKLADFLRGVTISRPAVSNAALNIDAIRDIFKSEDGLVGNLDHFYETLNRCRSFGQESIIEFPRKDDVIDVRVKNVVATSW